MSEHITVLGKEAVDALKLEEGSVAIDATANGGGHSREIHKKIGTEGLLIAIDVDPAAIALLKDSFTAPNVRIVKENFRNLEQVRDTEQLDRVDGILADLGWSTNQFETGGRGLSFRYDEPLLMTYGDPETYSFTAQDIVNRWDEEDIANVLYGYADERNSRKIARAIVEARREKEIKTTGDLTEIIYRVLPKKGRIDPATKTFQALRIAVNDEYGALRDLLDSSLRILSDHGRLAIITFHSGEDKIVKDFMRNAKDSGQGILITKKPITPARAEILRNPRARSAKLRVFEKQSLS